MAKKLLKKVKVQAVGGKATPAPPLGPVLGQAGINIGEFVNQFNEQTRDRMGDVCPVEISVYDDRSFDFIMKTVEGTARSMGIHIKD
jgi:large subunit ribosomal protein L11